MDGRCGEGGWMARWERNGTKAGFEAINRYLSNNQGEGFAIRVGGGEKCTSGDSWIFMVTLQGGYVVGIIDW